MEAPATSPLDSRAAALDWLIRTSVCAWLRNGLDPDYDTLTVSRYLYPNARKLKLANSLYVVEAALIRIKQEG